MAYLTPRHLAEERRQICRLPSALNPNPLSSTEFLCRNIDLIRLAKASAESPQTED